MIPARGTLSHGGLRKGNPDSQVMTGFYRSPGIAENDFNINSYGFRPNRSTYDAISSIYNRLTGRGWTYQWIIEGDIASYFDTIPHQKLMNAVKRRIADKNIQEVLWKFLRAGVMYRETFHETLTGTPQVVVISPLLANIYLDKLDKYMESTSLNLTQWLNDAKEEPREKETSSTSDTLMILLCYATEQRPKPTPKKRNLRNSSVPWD